MPNAPALFRSHEAFGIEKQEEVIKEEKRNTCSKQVVVQKNCY